ncbi:hypothetical protein V2W45_1329655 [Cenococcum geophilum]
MSLILPLRTTPSGSPTLSLNNGDGIKERAASTTRPTSPSPRHYISPYNTKPLEYRANNSYNYILDNLINGLTKESNNKDGNNITDKDKAKNYSDGSNNSNNTDNNDFRDSNSSSSNKDNEARGYTGQ